MGGVDLAGRPHRHQEDAGVPKMAPVGHHVFSRAKFRFLDKSRKALRCRSGDIAILGQPKIAITGLGPGGPDTEGDDAARLRS